MLIATLVHPRPDAALRAACCFCAIAVAGCSAQLDAPHATFAGPQRESAATPAKSRALRFERYLAAPHPLPHVRFGGAVALSGTSVAVNAPFESASGKPDDPAGVPSSYLPSGEGVTYLFDLAPHGREPLRIVAPNADPGDPQIAPLDIDLENTYPNLVAVGLALNDDFLIVGTGGEDGARAPADDADTQDVQDAQANNDARDAGAVYVYARGDLERGNSRLRQYLKAPTIAAGDLFGTTVALSGDLLVVGAPGVDCPGAKGGEADVIANCGAAYVFELRDGRFVFRQLLKAPAPHAEDAFGTSVALDGDLLVIGAPSEKAGSTDHNGAAYVFRRRDDRFEPDGRLAPDVASSGSVFGTAVRVANGRIAVGSPGARSCTGEAPAMFGSGAAYLFSGDGWPSRRCLESADPTAMALFGYSIGLSNAGLVAGAPWDDSGRSQHPEDRSVEFSGAAYVEADGPAAGQRAPAYVKAPQITLDDVFGVAVDMDAERVVVGASQRSHDEHGRVAPVYSGAVYVFRLDASDDGGDAGP